MKTVFLLASLILTLIPVFSSGYEFGSKVMSDDDDYMWHLSDIPGGASIGFWDIGTSGYDQGDPVYLHMGRFRHNMMTKTNDIRLTWFDNCSPGSKLKPGENDTNAPLTILPATINYHDSYGRSGSYDLSDPVYLHIYFNNHNYLKVHPEMNIGNSGHQCRDEKESPFKKEDFETRLRYRGEISIPGVNCIEFSDGYKLLIKDQLIDKIPREVGMCEGSKVEMIRGTNTYYYHIIGTWLMKIALYEMVSHDQSDDDTRDRDSMFASAPLFIRTNDVRLSRLNTTLGPGTKVGDYEPDQNMVLELPALANFLDRDSDAGKIRYVDRDGDGYDDEDYVYLNYPSRKCGQEVMVNNVRLTPVNASPSS